MAVLYSLAAITPDTEFGLSFYDYFTEEERFALWRVASLREYLPKMNSAPSRGLSIDMAKPLMRQLLGSAQEAVDGLLRTAEQLPHQRLGHVDRQPAAGRRVHFGQVFPQAGHAPQGEPLLFGEIVVERQPEFGIGRDRRQ